MENRVAAFFAKKLNSEVTWRGLSSIVRPLLGLLILPLYLLTLVWGRNWLVSAFSWFLDKVGFVGVAGKPGDALRKASKHEMHVCMVYAIALLNSAAIFIALKAALMTFLPHTVLFGLYGHTAVLVTAIAIAAMGALVNFCLGRVSMLAVLKEGFDFKNTLRMKQLEKRKGTGFKWLMRFGFMVTALLTVGAAAVSGAIYLRTFSMMGAPDAVQHASHLILGKGALGHVLPFLLISMVLTVYSILFFKDAYKALKTKAEEKAHEPYEARLQDGQVFEKGQRNPVELGNVRRINITYYIDQSGQKKAHRLMVETKDGKRYVVEASGLEQSDATKRYLSFFTTHNEVVKRGDALLTEDCLDHDPSLGWGRRMLKNILPVTFALIAMSAVVFFTWAGMDDLAGLGAGVALKWCLAIANGLGSTYFFAKGGAGLGAYVQRLLSHPVRFMADKLWAEKDAHGHALYKGVGSQNGAKYMRHGEGFVLHPDHLDDQSVRGPYKRVFSKRALVLNLMVGSFYLFSIVSLALGMAGVFTPPLYLILGFFVAKWAVQKVYGLYHELTRAKAQAKVRPAVQKHKDSIAVMAEKLNGGAKPHAALSPSEAQMSSPDGQAAQRLKDKRESLKKAFGEDSILESVDYRFWPDAKKKHVSHGVLRLAANDDVQVLAKKVTALLDYISDGAKQAKRAAKVAAGYVTCKEAGENKQPYIALNGITHKEDPVFLVLNAIANGSLVANEGAIAKYAALAAASLSTGAFASAAACGGPNMAALPSIYVTMDEYKLIQSFVDKMVEQPDPQNQEAQLNANGMYVAGGVGLSG